MYRILVQLCTEIGFTAAYMTTLTASGGRKGQISFLHLSPDGFNDEVCVCACVAYMCVYI